MYAGIMDQQLNNMNAVTAQLGTNRQNRMARNNAQDYRTSMQVEQDNILRQMQEENPSQYEYMMKQKMVQNSSPNTGFMDRILGAFGGR